MNFLQRRNNHYINENLLDKVERDEVEDRDSLSNVLIYFHFDALEDYKCRLENDDRFVNYIIDRISKCLQKSWFVDRFEKPFLVYKTAKVSVEFYTERMSLDDFFYLVHQITGMHNDVFQKAKRCIENRDGTRLEYFRSDERNNNLFNLELFDKKIAMKFVSSYFPDCSYDDFIKSFCRTYSKIRYVQSLDKDAIYKFVITKNGKRRENYFNLDNCFLSDVWFDFSVVDFYDGGFLKVRMQSGGFNIMNNKGELLLDKPVYYCGELNDGIFVVYDIDNDNGNFIDTNGNKLFPDGMFGRCYKFNEGYGVVQNNNKKDKLNYKKMNFVDKNGILLFPERWLLEEAKPFMNGFARVRVAGEKRWKFIDKTGKFLDIEIKINEIYSDFNEGLAAVNHNKFGCTFINEKGKLAFPGLYFNYCCMFYEGFAMVRRLVDSEFEFNYINTKGELISPGLWFDECENFENGLAKVHKEHLGDNWLNMNGELVCEWEAETELVEISNIGKLIKVVNNEGFVNYIKPNKEYVFDEWIDGDYGFYVFGNELVSKEGVRFDMSGRLVSLI